MPDIWRLVCKMYFLYLESSLKIRYRVLFSVPILHLLWIDNNSYVNLARNIKIHWKYLYHIKSQRRFFFEKTCHYCRIGLHYMHPNNKYIFQWKLSVVRCYLIQYDLYLNLPKNPIIRRFFIMLFYFTVI